MSLEHLFDQTANVPSPASPGSAISRYEAAKREVTRRALTEHPEMLPETVARHYTSLATTAMQLRECINARKAGSPDMDEVIAHYMGRLRQCYIADFGDEPHWPNKELCGGASPSASATVQPKP